MSVYLNNAATTWPKPPCVAEAVYDFIANHGANVARGSASARDMESLDYTFTCRGKIAHLLGAYGGDPAYVTFTGSVTQSLNTVIKVFLKDGMRVVTSSMEHNAVMRPLRAAEAGGVALDIVQCSLRGYLDPKSLERALERRADLVIIPHCSNVCGSLQDLTAIAAVCAAKNVPLVVDAAQTAGIVPINAEELGLAALCFTGHKGLLGPQGTGGIVWRPDFADGCPPFLEGGTGSLSHEEFQPSQMPDKYESGTPNLPGIVGLLAALEWMEKEGMTTVRAREEQLGRGLEEGLRSIKGVRMLGPGCGDKKLPVFAINVYGKDNGRLARDLSDIYGIETRPGLHCSPLAHRTLGSFPEGALRLSPGYFNSEENIEHAVFAIKELSKSQAQFNRKL